jgi:hypothetical protein
MNGGQVNSVTNFQPNGQTASFHPLLWFGDPPGPLLPPPCILQALRVVGSGWNGKQALNQQFWLDTARENLIFFNRTVHSITGMNPDYLDFSGIAKDHTCGGTVTPMMAFAMTHGALQ